MRAGRVNQRKLKENKAVRLSLLKEECARSVLIIIFLCTQSVSLTIASQTLTNILPSSFALHSVIPATGRLLLLTEIQHLPQASATSRSLTIRIAQSTIPTADIIVSFFL
jgi:hypothetical protein